MSSDSTLETLADRTDARSKCENMMVESSGLPSPVPETSPPQAFIHLVASSPEPLSPALESLPSPSSDYSPAVVLPDQAGPSDSNTLPCPAQPYIQIIMPESLYGDSDYSSDTDSIWEIQCCQARAVRFLHPGKPSVVDLMKAEKPVFKRASQIIVRRPVGRPFISPVQPPKGHRRSSTESTGETSCSEASYSPLDRSSPMFRPATPTLDDDEGSASITSDASPSTPETPRSSFEQERRCFEAYKQSPEPLINQARMSETPSLADVKQKFRRPSRLRLFPKRSVTINTGSEAEVSKVAPQIPPMILESGSKSASDVFNINTPRPWLTDVGVRSPQLPPSPALSTEPPLTAKLMGSRSLWREAGRSRFLRRVESRVGLNTVH